MVENGLYVIKRELLEIINHLGGDCDITHGDKRPVFCCLNDNKIDGLYWAIPTSDLSHRDDGQKEHYEFCLERPDNDIRSCYYHIAKTTKDALYKRYTRKGRYDELSLIKWEDLKKIEHYSFR